MFKFTDINDEDAQQLLNALEDFMNHYKSEELHHEIHTPRHTVVIDNMKVEIPEESTLIEKYEEEAAKLEVTVDYYMSEFI